MPSRAPSSFFFQSASQSGFSLIEVSITLLLLTLTISFSAQWIAQTAKLHNMSNIYTQLLIIGSNICNSLAAGRSPDSVKSDWEPKIQAIRKGSVLTITACHDGVIQDDSHMSNDNPIHNSNHIRSINDNSDSHSKTNIQINKKNNHYKISLDPNHKKLKILTWSVVF